MNEKVTVKIKKKNYKRSFYELKYNNLYKKKEVFANIIILAWKQNHVTLKNNGKKVERNKKKIKRKRKPKQTLYWIIYSI